MIERVLAADGDAIVFAHGHILRILGARWVGAAPEFAASLGLDTAALCELGFQRERRVIWLWNDTRPPALSPGRCGVSAAAGTGHGHGGDRPHDRDGAPRRRAGG